MPTFQKFNLSAGSRCKLLKLLSEVQRKNGPVPWPLTQKLFDISGNAYCLNFTFCTKYFSFLCDRVQFLSLLNLVLFFWDKILSSKVFRGIPNFLLIALFDYIVSMFFECRTPSSINMVDHTSTFVWVTPAILIPRQVIFAWNFCNHRLVVQPSGFSPWTASFMILFGHRESSIFTKWFGANLTAISIMMQSGCCLCYYRSCLSLL